MNARPWLLSFALSALTAMAHAESIQIDMNGFVPVAGGQVTGDGLKDPVKFTAADSIVKLDNLKPDTVYYVDFFHNSGPLSSDFLFTTDKTGKAVSSVTLGGEKYNMLVGFKPGSTTLKLNTHTITFNPDRMQTGGFVIHGLNSENQGLDTPPITATVIPGTLAVDNFGGPPESKVYRFAIDSAGKVSPIEGAEEYAEFVDNLIKPRATKVHFKIAASAPVNYVVTHAMTNLTTLDNVIEFDLLLPVGGGGVNVWTFGPTKVFLSTMMLPGGKPYEGTETDNDLVFTPHLRYDKATGFYFETAKGKSVTVMADVNGQTDDKQSVLKATVTATILQPKPTATQPSTAPSAPSKK